MKVIYALLALALLKNIISYKVYHSVPALELKRRARQNDKRAAAIYKAVTYGASLDLLLWSMGTAAGAVLVIWSVRTNWWLPVIVVVVSTWLVVWGKFGIKGWGGAAAAWFARPHAKVLSFIHPALRPIAGLLPPGRRVHLHTGLYEKRDILDLLSKQNSQVDNRIPEEDLKIAFHALQFGDKTVGSIMTPRSQVTFVTAGDTVGPKLVDELHKSGHNRFPVAKEVSRNFSSPVTGILYLSDLSLDDLKEKTGKVKDFMRRKVSFINEDASLRQALSAFLKSHHHLLVVVNNFEEFVGVVTLEDLLEQIVGESVIKDADDHENLHSAAAQDVKEEHTAHDKVEPEQTAQTVVE